MRNNTIDFARFIAAFFVIALHVGNYKDVSETFGEFARLSGRWAVPFFFVVAGYFIGLQGKESKCHTQALRILKIFLISSMLFVPFSLLKDPNKLLSISIVGLFRSGTYFHLWFLSSLIVGLLSFQILQKKFPKLLTPASVILIIAFIITDIAAYIEPGNIFTRLDIYVRHTISLAFIIIGYKISRLNVHHSSTSNRFFLLAFSTLTILYFVEPFLTELLIGSDTIRRQFPAFTALLTISIMLLCLKGNMGKTLFSEAGKNFSLGIYLVHPLFIPLSREVFNYCPILPKTIQVVIMTFLLSWLSISILMRRAPFLYRLLYGEFKFIRR
jgi:surface polysaccharide O-acyltransferase-like enzyme